MLIINHLKLFLVIFLLPISINLAPAPIIKPGAPGSDSIEIDKVMAIAIADKT